MEFSKLFIKNIYDFLFHYWQTGCTYIFISFRCITAKKSIETNEDVLSFYKKNLLPIFIVNIAWVFIYNAYFLLAEPSIEVTAESIIREILLIKQVPLPNMWYFPMIMGIYIGIPFVAKIVKTFSLKSVSILLVLIFITEFILPFINICLKIQGNEIIDPLNSVVKISFFGGSYGLYIILGYYMTLNKEIKISKTALFIISALNFGITLFIQLISYNRASLTGEKYIYSVWYNFPFLLLSAASLFLFICKLDCSKMNKYISNTFIFVSKISLSVFFMHIIIQRLLNPYIAGLGIITPLKVILLAATNTAICIIFNLILSKTRFISKYVLLIKN